MKDNLRIYGVKDSCIKYLGQYQEHLFLININNMIPVPKGQLVELNINAEKDSHYKFLLQAESREISKQKCRIRKMRRLSNS